MTTPKKLYQPADNGCIYIDTAPTPPTTQPPSNNNGTVNAPTLHRQRQQRGVHGRRTCNNKENNTNSNDGEGWPTVNSKGKKVKDVKPDPPPRQTMSSVPGNNASGNNAFSYANVAAQRVRNQQLHLFVKLQNEFKRWSQIITDSVLLQTLDQHQYDEESTRRALFGFLANNNGKDSSAFSSNKVNHFPAPLLPDDFPELQKMSASKSEKKRAPMQHHQAPGPSLPSSTSGVTSGLGLRKSVHSSLPPAPTFGDYLPSEMGTSKQSRTRSFDMAASSAGSSRPGSGNTAPTKSQKRSGTPEQSHVDLIVLDDSDDDASGNKLWESTEEKKAVEDAIAETNKVKDAVLAGACQKYPDISSDALHQILETAQYDVDIVQDVCDKQGSASIKLDYDTAMQKYEELKTRVHNLRCYRDNRRIDYCKHMLHVLHPDNLPEELWCVFTQAQGKCPLPNWRKKATNLDGRTSILDGGTMEACSSVQTAIAWSQSLPISSFKYGNGGNFARASVNVHGCLNFLVNNYVDVCPISTYTCEPPEGGTWNCPNPTPNQITDVVDILHLQFQYLLLLGFPVLYLNMGGTAVKPIMQQVLRRLQNDRSITPTMLKMLCVIDSNLHMYKAAYCFEDYAVDTDAGLIALGDYTTELTNFAFQISNQIMKFYNDLNRVREGLSLDPIACSNIFDQLVKNKRVAYIARKGNKASWNHMLHTYSVQKRTSYDNGLGADEQLSELGPNGLKRSSASSQWGDTDDFVMNDNAAAWTNILDINPEQQSTSRTAAVVTNSKEHSIVDVEPFIQFISTFDNAQPKMLTAAIELPFLRLPQALVDLVFKKQEGLRLYNTLEQVTFDTLSVLGPLSTLNGIVGAFLLDEATKMNDAATKMKKVVNLSQAGIGSIISYLDESTASGAEDEAESSSLPDEVMAVKEAIYRATHGNYGIEVDEETRRTINNAVSNSQLEKHVNIGFDTSNLITNMLDILFILFVMSKLSILEIYEYLSKQDSLIKSLEEFARRVNPEGYFDAAMMGIEFLFEFAAPALLGKHRDEAYKVTNSLLCSLNKIVSVNNNASAEAKTNDPRKKKFLSTFRDFECQASDGTEDTNAAKYWSGTGELNRARRSRAGRNFGNHFCRVVIEECVPPDTFSKLGYTQSFFCVSPSMIGKKCSYIKPELYSKCKDVITNKIAELKTSFMKKENTGKRTIFIENEEQRNRLERLVKTYEALQSD